jgi:hypothetical protein
MTEKAQSIPARSPITPPSNRRRVLLWFGFFGGALAYTLEEVVGYVLIPASCGGGKLPHYVLDLIVVLATLAAGIVSVLLWRELSREAERTGVVREGARLVAFGGIVANALFLVITIAIGVSAFFLGACQL